MGRRGCPGMSKDIISGELSLTGFRIFLGCIFPGADVAEGKQGPSKHTVSRDSAVLSTLGEGPEVTGKVNSCIHPLPAPLCPLDTPAPWFLIRTNQAEQKEYWAQSTCSAPKMMPHISDPSPLFLQDSVPSPVNHRVSVFAPKLRVNEWKCAQ